MDELGALEQWLGGRLGREVSLTHQGKPGSGFSAETSIVADAGGERFVLRKETPDPPVYPTQVPGLTTEVDIQYRVMSAVSSHSDVPIAPLFGYEGDESVLGAPFFVMGFVDGVVPIESPMYTLEGWFTELTPASRTAMIDDGVDVLSRVHAIDWRAAGLSWLDAEGTPTARRQLEIWSQYGARELRGRSHPVYEEAEAWLRANLPEETEPVLCWGDPRLGNMIWRDDRCVCVTDFEAASIAPVEVDVGWWLMFDRWCHESSDAPRREGEPTRDEQRARYEQQSGRQLVDLGWFEVMAAWRYCAIVVRVMNRTVERGLLDAENTMWRDTNVSTCLEQLLEEHAR